MDLRAVGGDGVSANIMLGLGPSSVATRVMGTGFDENFGVDACLDIGGLFPWL